MYSITIQKIPKQWYRRKGGRKFKKTFNTLSELVKFSTNNRNIFYYPELMKELTKQEYRILLSKVNSVYNNIRSSEYGK